MNTRTGFSVLEIMIVVSLIATVLGICYFNIPNYLYVHIELDRIYSLCKLVQHRARVDGCTYEIIFDEKKGTIKTPFIEDVLTDGVEFGIINNVYGPPSSPAYPLKKAITFLGSRVRCNADGMMQAGTIYITDKKRQCLYALTIGVSPIPYLRRYVYKHSWVPV